ncbi:hypothetical protein ABIA26_001710 [Sinorhizobium fredii]
MTSSGARQGARFPGVRGVAGHILAGAQPDGLRPALLLRLDRAEIPERIAYAHTPRKLPAPAATAIAPNAKVPRAMPVPYFHVVFTVPAEIAAIACQNKRQLYTILFEAAAEPLKTIAADPGHLGGELGFLAILHTWG